MCVYVCVCVCVTEAPFVSLCLGKAVPDDGGLTSLPAPRPWHRPQDQAAHARRGSLHDHQPDGALCVYFDYIYICICIPLSLSVCVCVDTDIDRYVYIHVDIDR